MRSYGHNRELPPLPTDDEILDALEDLEFEQARSLVYRYGVTTNRLAQRLGVDGARRLGNGAVKGSWSGRMSGSLRLAPRLRSMAQRGLLRREYDRETHRWVWFTP